MKKLHFLFLAGAMIIFVACTDQTKSYKTETHTDENGYSYETVTNDPTGLRLYTLKNGLKVYLSRNTDAPRIQTYIPVRAGSNYDPKESTGLAHYLEHMLFKGTSKIGTQDWEKEKILLQKISDLYEQHKAEKDPEKKKKIYKKIDKISLEASKYSIANEYRTMMSSMGATTNAFTMPDRTVYRSNIPANELQKWLSLEAERFSQLVLRLFHTELEVVYEEFNRSQDRDLERDFKEMVKVLYPTHPMGQQLPIGKPSHLKNPSMIDIHHYFNTYYVPNNMAIVLVGDLEFDVTIKMIDIAFGGFESKEVIYPKLPKELPMTSVVEREVFDSRAESVSISFRTEEAGSDEQKYVTLVDMLLANREAGLIDLNLNQQQRVQSARTMSYFFNDYGFHMLSGRPKEGQSLEEVKQLLLDQIALIKQGTFEEWMLEAVINDLKLRDTRGYQNNTSLASQYYNAFIHRQDWQDRVAFLDELRKISKEELVAFANTFYKDNYVVVYKRKGEDKNMVKVENPRITPVHLNRDKQSDFVKKFNETTSPDLKPVYVDYQQEIQTSTLSNGVSLASIENKSNDLFNLNIIFDMGSDHDKKLALAVGYMEYLGTEKYTAEALKKEFYKLGINYGVNTQNHQSRVYISGLQENLTKGLELLEHLWDNAVVNQEAYEKYVARILKGRTNTKTQKNNILFTGLLNYAVYGEDSRLRNIYTAEELQQINSQELVDLIKDLKNYEQRIFYYGNNLATAKEALNAYHTIPKELKAHPEPLIYTAQETGNKVYFVDYDMVQTELMLISKGAQFDPKKIALSRMFGSYFGNILFDDIRESQSLAYHTYITYSNANAKDESDLVYAYVGTQANKLPQAVDAMLNLMTQNDMPKIEKQFKRAKKAILKQLAAQRVTRDNIFWTYENLKRRGLTHDNRKDIYEAVEKMTLDDLATFFEKEIKKRKYTAVVIGNKKDIDLKSLQKLGKVKELDVDYIFNYKSAEIIKP